MTSPARHQALVRCMGDAGFGGPGAFLYAVLLTSGTPMTSRELAQRSDRRRVAVLADLVTLQEHGLVGEHRDQNRTVWFALDPAVSWLTHLAESLWAEGLDWRPARELSSAREMQVMRRVRVLAMSLWRPHDLVRQRPAARVRNARLLEQLLAQSISIAQGKIRAASGISTTGEWPWVQRRVMTSVACQRITVVDEIYERGLAGAARDLASGVQVKIGPGAFDQPVYLVDSNVLITLASDPTTVGQLSDDRSTIERFRTQFDEEFATAEPAAAVIGRCAATAKAQIESASELSEDATDLLHGLVKLGVSSRPTQEAGWNSGRTQTARAELLTSGHAIVTAKGDLLPNWSAWVESKEHRP